MTTDEHERDVIVAFIMICFGLGFLLGVLVTALCV